MLALLVLICDTTVAVVLVTSAVTKLGSQSNTQTWRTLLGRSALSRRAGLMSWLHVLAEFAVGAALLLNVATVPALAAATLLTASFTALAVYAERSGRTIVCSCFGRPGAPLSRPHTLRNLALTAMAAFALIGATVAPPSAGPRPSETLLAFAFAFLATLASVFLDDIVALFKGNVGTERRQSPTTHRGT